MSDIAEIAKENAIQIECKKDGLKQRQSGDWTITFTVAGDSMPADLTTAPMGTRYLAVLVELADNEEPVNKRRWSDMKPSAQCAIRLVEPLFITFLREEYGLPVTAGHEEALAFVKTHLGIESRKELNTPGPEADAWLDMDKRYYAWTLAG